MKPQRGSKETWEDIVAMTDFELYIIDISIEELEELAEDRELLRGKAEAYGSELQPAQEAVGAAIINYYNTKVELEALDEWDARRYA